MTDITDPALEAYAEAHTSPPVDLSAGAGRETRAKLAPPR